MNQDTGLVHHLEVTAANVYDVMVMPKLLTGEEKNVYGDSGYLGAGKREDAVTHNNEICSHPLSANVYMNLKEIM